MSGLNGRPEKMTGAVRAALRKTTETLATQSEALAPIAPNWSKDEWLIARAAASLHGVAPLLAGTLRWQGPAGWQQFLADQRAHTVQRHERIESLLVRIDARARSQGIAIVGLKGVALHATGVYMPGERPMADVDLLVRPEDSDRTSQMLGILGFQETVSTWKHRSFEPAVRVAPSAFGEHADNAIKVELHTRISEIMPERVTDVTERVFPRQPHPGLNAYRSRGALLLHVLLHAAGAMCFRSIRMLHLHDISRLVERMTDEDWDEFLAPSASGPRALWWAFPPLMLVARYHLCVPQRVLAAAEQACPGRLRYLTRSRTLSDVSLSNPRISAFPGIEWAQSLSEVAAYVKERFMPSALTVVARDYTVSHQPALVGTTWSAQSSSRRMLRWLLSRPARPDTLFAVRTALAQTP